MRRWGTSAVALLLAVAPVQAQAPAVDPAELGRQVDALLTAQGDGATAGIWLGGTEGAARFARDADRPRPTASAIKTFYLVELYAAHAQALDAPLPGADAALDDAHPAISHFTPEQRDEIRRGLRGASVRRIGLVMMGTAPASNVVYNAAANLTTAALGGPGPLTARIRQRDAAFAGVAARRYMLRDRKEHGDNEAPPIALATLYQRLAARRLAGIDGATMDAIHEALRRPDAPGVGRHFAKTGELNSDPITMVRAGWYDAAGGPLVYVVMTVQPAPGADGREASGTRLARTADALRDALVAAGRR